MSCLQFGNTRLSQFNFECVLKQWIVTNCVLNKATKLTLTS